MCPWKRRNYKEKGGDSNIGELKAYRNITFQERVLIEQLSKKGIDVEEIAKVCGYTISSIYRELDRCPSTPYNATVAQLGAERRKEERKQSLKNQAQRKREERIQKKLQISEQRTETLLLEFTKKLEEITGKIRGRRMDLEEFEEIIDQTNYYKIEVRKESTKRKRYRKGLEDSENHDKKNDSCGDGTDYDV